MQRGVRPGFLVFLGGVGAVARGAARVLSCPQRPAGSFSPTPELDKTAASAPSRSS
ncbi:protein of unknown function [Candidatus Methylocalor cossyra]|uniref:Uncharacterized protein n=1 Tax=Candidatus Methylocalor cossyra TaxID=3108543 RepID=A0ABP1CC73_9GAMM